MPNNYILTSQGSFMSEDELYHHGILGMKWGVRRYRNPDGSLTSAGRKKAAKKASKLNKKARKRGRVFDDGNPNVVGVRQKNGDILFVDRNEFNTKGIDVAEQNTLKMVREATAARKAKIKNGKSKADKILRSEEKTLIKDMIDTYDMSDPDSKEALSILRELEKDLK